jgi:hypothetical protein
LSATPNLQEIVEKAWTNPSYKQQLLADPKTALAEAGMRYADDVAVRLHENTTASWHFAIPLKDALAGRDPETLSPVAGKVIKKAWSDPSFKARLLANPVAAIAEATSVRVPKGLSVHVHEDSLTVRNLVLPSNPAEVREKELSDDDLARVAGGKAPGDGYAFEAWGWLSE